MLALPLSIAAVGFRDRNSSFAVHVRVAARILSRRGLTCESVARGSHGFTGLRDLQARNARVAMTAAPLDYGLPARGTGDGNECEGLRARRSPRLARVRTFLTLFTRSLTERRRHGRKTRRRLRLVRPPVRAWSLGSLRDFHGNPWTISRVSTWSHACCTETREGVAEPLCEVRDYRRDQLPPPWKGDGEVMSGLDRGA